MESRKIGVVRIVLGEEDVRPSVEEQRACFGIVGSVGLAVSCDDLDAGRDVVCQLWARVNREVFDS